MRTKISITMREELLAHLPKGERASLIEAALVAYLKLDPATLRKSDNARLKDYVLTLNRRIGDLGNTNRMMLDQIEAIAAALGMKWDAETNIPYLPVGGK